MKLKSQKGFTGIEALLIVFVVALIGGAGFYVYKAQKNTNESLNNTGNSELVEKPKSEETKKESAVNPNEGFLVIKEWGVKIKMRDYNKVNYKYDGKSDYLTGNIYDSFVTPEIKSSYLQDKSCKLSVVMARTSKNYPQDYQVKAGSYYYAVGGSPYMCGSKSVEELRKRVLEDFTTDNIKLL